MREISDVISQLHSIEKKLDTLNGKFMQKDPPFLDMDEGSDYLKIKKNTLYCMTSKNEIPFFKRGRKIYFDKNELDNWILDRNNYHKSNQQIDSEATTKVLIDNGKIA